MISKALISQIRLLHHKKHREEQGVFIVEGIKSCMETLQSNWEVIQCFITERFDVDSFNAKDTKEMQNTQRMVISEKEMQRISLLSTAPEILCIVQTPHYTLNEFHDKKPLLVLDAIRDPGNLGTIIRTADWFGFDQILCSEDCVEFTNPKVIQATMGSFARVKMVYSDLLDFLKTQQHRTVYGLYMDGEPIQKQLFKNNDIVIIGSESHGISEMLVPFIQKEIEISLFPHQGTSPESLNAAIAAGIFMYEHRKKMKKELLVTRNL
ncbi:MAG: RNA methyltransferase [Lentimicrobiaceae bacterium]|nr:RNA methyltransferase [Lentimicrobiaceae bacterium]